VRFATVPLTGLEPGKQATISVKLDTTSLRPGEYKIIVVVDSWNQVEEQNENNNTMFKILRLT